MALTNVQSIDELYRDRLLYRDPYMSAPPSERLPHVIRFMLTTGCSWQRCTFCKEYDGIKHSVNDDYERHVDEIWEMVGNRSPLASGLERIFIGQGNALEVETDRLHAALEYTNRRFFENTGHLPRRVSIYGRTDDILKHGKGLKRLQYQLSLIYWGVESGSSEVLEYVDKGSSRKKILEAAKYLNKTGISTSVMIMPGLGGKRFYKQHVKDTAKVLGAIRPAYITFMGINPPSGSRYSRMMEEDEDNRPLTDRETAEQMIEIIGRMPFFPTMIGCFNRRVDCVGYNPMPFGKKRITWEEDRSALLATLHKLARGVPEQAHDEAKP